MAKFTLIVRCEEDGSEYQLGEADGSTPGEVYVELGTLMWAVGSHIVSQQNRGVVDKVNETFHQVKELAVPGMSEEEVDRIILETLHAAMNEGDSGRQTD